MKRNELPNMALYISGIAEIFILTIGVAILHGVHSNASAEQNKWGLSILMIFGSAAWLVLAIPWLVLEKWRIRSSLWGRISSQPVGGNCKEPRRRFGG